MTWARIVGSLVSRPLRPAIEADERELLDAIVAEPDDDAPRLVYADWLQARAEPILAARGELIIVQCALEHEQDPAEHNRLKARDFELVEQHGNTWCAHAGIGAVRYNWYDSDWEAAFRRGFIDTVSMPARDFPGLAGSLFTNEPVQRLNLLGYHDEVMARLPASIYLRRLRALGLRGLWRYPFGQRYLLEALPAAALATIVRSPHLSKLERLEVEDNPVGDAGAVAISMSTALGGLRELCLRNAEIGADGLHALTSSPLASQLEELVLDRNPIGDRGVALLASSSRLASLRRLSLTGTDLGDAARRSLIQRFGAAVEL